MDNSNIENRYIAVLAVDNDTGLFYGGISFIFFLEIMIIFNFGKGIMRKVS